METETQRALTSRSPPGRACHLATRFQGPVACAASWASYVPLRRLAMTEDMVEDKDSTVNIKRAIV